ncbi:YvrJ family protein [Pseudalkalibacillus salsuginis]|nr:YvrJ family protein [Pseudalkalibacillus salsuginis]MCF6409227.1 YvrJ family protein [Pseudalkalibacillus salsuginis]
MEQWVSVMSEFGFPVVVTLYLLHRIEAKLDSLNQSINNLPNQLKG